MNRFCHAVSLVVFTLISLTSSASAQEISPSVALYTMGPGHDVFSRFGHAALCVRDSQTPEGRCYNYGTTDFSTPVPLTYNVLKGRARFWVSVSPLDRMLAWYGADGERRTVWRQNIALSPEAFEALEQRLRNDLRPESREYVYHHFRDNCTTRIRDHLDEVTHHVLRARTQQAHDQTWRAMVFDGLGSSAGLLIAGELLLGKPLDVVPTVWEAMFLPEVMRREIASTYAAPLVAVYVRPDVFDVSRPWMGKTVLVALAGLLVLGAMSARTQRVTQVVGAVLLGASAWVVWGLATVSSLPELSSNDMRAVLWPTDLALPFLPAHVVQRYARARLVTAMVLSAASASGVTQQPLTVMCLLVVAAMSSWISKRAT
jgi:hypothetical protein